MLGEGTPAIFVTFLLAMVGYAGLTVVFVLSLRGSLPRALWRGVAAVILVHVAMVWTFRYGGDASLALRNGVAGFALFHAAAVVVPAPTLVRERAALVLIRLAFAIVTLGAVGATFRYDVVAVYRVPVLVCAAAGIAGLAWHLATRRRLSTSSTSP